MICPIENLSRYFIQYSFSYKPDYPKCGVGYSCLKITQPSQVFNVYGEYVPPAERRGDTTVFRGCFVLDIHKVTTYYCGNAGEKTMFYCPSLIMFNHNVSRMYVTLLPMVSTTVGALPEISAMVRRKLFTPS